MKSKRLSQMSGPGTFEQANYYELGPSMNVCSWCPTPDGSGPPTQVHVHLGRAPGNVMTVRLKSAEVCDALIEALQIHRKDVWGEP